MGQVITRNASAERIMEDVSKTLTHAAAQGGEVKTIVEKRLLTINGALTVLDSQLTQAENVADALHAVLMARDAESDLEIGAVLDEIWNTLGRPAQSVDYDLIAGAGKSAWTSGDPAKQPHLMKVLANNIRQTQNPRLSEKREAWATRIELMSAPQADAAAPLDAADAHVTSLRMQRRTLANAAQVELTRLKRELKNLGMTEAQVHDIIPDTPQTTNRAAPNAPQPAP